jgi:hypothetical protein
MNLRRAAAVLCILSITCPMNSLADISADLNKAVSDIQTDSIKISQWISDQLKTAVPYNSTSGNVVPAQLKLLGFEVGVEGVVTGTKMDVDGLRHLGTTLVDTTKIDTFNRLPFPMVLGHAKIGLPFGIDGGIRLGGIPSMSSDKDKTKGHVKNKVIGIDVRKALIEEGAAKPFGLTVGLNYTHADGEISVTTPYDYNTTVHIGVTDYTTTSNSDSTLTSKWKTNSVGAQALLHKKILFMTPYLGASANHNSGHIDTDVTTTGSIALNGTSKDIGTLTGSANAAAEKWDVRGLAGIEFAFLPFMRLGIGLDYAGSRKIGASLGLRVHFGGLKS